MCDVVINTGCFDDLFRFELGLKSESLLSVINLSSNSYILMAYTTEAIALGNACQCW